MKTSRSENYQDFNIENIDLRDPYIHGNGEPHLIWEALRHRAPLYWHKATEKTPGYWSVTRYTDCQWVLKDHSCFTSEKGTLLSILGIHDPASKKQMAVTDPPAHSNLREPLTKALNNHQVKLFAKTIRHEIKQQLQPLIDGDVIDLAASTAWLSIATAALFMDLPRDDWHALTKLTNMSIAPDDQSYMLESGADLTMQRGHRELFAYFTDIVEQRRKNPGSDLVSLLLKLKVDGVALSQGTVISNCYSLLLGANVTTPHVPTATLLELIASDLYDKWRINIEHCHRTAVEEALRWSSPASHFMRYATKDLTLHGKKIKKGDAVVAWIGSANRDERAFPEPFIFDLYRKPNKHITFGFGPHLCVGHVAARQTLDIFFDEIFRTFSSFTLIEDPVHLNSNFIAGIKTMKVSADILKN